MITKTSVVYIAYELRKSMSNLMTLFMKNVGNNLDVVLELTAT